MTQALERGWKPLMSALAMLSISQYNAVTDGIKISASASCNEEQIHKCSEAAVDNKLGTLEAGGVCEENKYVAFTHVCTVTDYRPSVDFCCCAFQHKALCCRYHQDWSRFRCTESEDTVDVLSRRGLPLHILLPAILGPIGLVLFCLFCCIRCHCRNDDDDEKTRWSCWCYKRKSDKSELSDSPSSGASGRGHMITYQNTRPGTAERQPLHTYHSDQGVKVPLTDMPEGQRLMAMPSAPPLDDDECPYMFSHQPGNGPSGSASDTIPQCPPYCPHHHGLHHHHHHHNHNSHPAGCGGGSGDSAGGCYGRQDSVFADSPPGPPSCPHQHIHQVHPGPCCFVQQTSVPSCGGCSCSRQNSAVTQESTCSGDTAPQASSPSQLGYPDMESPSQINADSSASSPNGYGGNPYAPPRTVCPSCSSISGLPPPPGYEESLGHRIMN